jgi:hypothetical protein
MQLADVKECEAVESQLETLQAALESKEQEPNKRRRKEEKKCVITL